MFFTCAAMMVKLDSEELQLQVDAYRRRKYIRAGLGVYYSDLSGYVYLSGFGRLFLYLLFVLSLR